jgi:hypothetical protein
VAAQPAQALALFLLLAVPAFAAPPLSVEQAYAAVQHRRTPFDARAGKLPASATDALHRFFTLSDQLVVARVSAMRAQAEGDAKGLQNALEAYDAGSSRLRSEPLTAEVGQARDLVLEAMSMQKRFLASRPAGSMRFVRAELQQAPDVKQASLRLHRAYSILMRAYPETLGGQRQAFFDHLCALDFL